MGPVYLGHGYLDLGHGYLVTLRPDYLGHGYPKLVIKNIGYLGPGYLRPDYLKPGYLETGYMGSDYLRQVTFELVTSDLTTPDPVTCDLVTVSHNLLPPGQYDLACARMRWESVLEVGHVYKQASGILELTGSQVRPRAVSAAVLERGCTGVGPACVIASITCE